VDDNEVKPLKKYHFENVVSKEIYLNLQEDEIEFTDELFQQIYYEIIHQLNQEETISVDAFVNNEDIRIANLVTNILMDEEKYALSDWNRKKVYPPSKEDNLSKMVLDAIYNLRRVLIEKKIKSLISEMEQEDINNPILDTVVNYTNLKQKLFERLNRVI
jgi:DNA primase